MDRLGERERVGEWKMLRRMGWLLGIAVLVIFLLHDRTLAQSSFSLQADINNLRSEVNQLRSEVSRLSGSRSPAIYPPPTSTPSRRINPTDSQIVDRLAILAIEAKDRLNALEARVARLEKRTR